jgi:hypothetical protein
MTTAITLFEEIHGNTQYLSQQAIIDFAEKYHARKLRDATSAQLNDTYYNSEETRNKSENKFDITQIP